jgi:16S rRNA (guanine966-N2)-methyltransferase
MKDRVREAVFNLLGPMVRDSHVIDLFAGTGALGLEALSRGAQHAVFIERHFPTVDVIRKNVTSLAIESYVEVVASDTFFWALREKGFSKQPVETTWVVFCSPPYAFYVDRADEMVRLIEAAINAAPAGSMIVVESDERFDVRQSRPSTTWDVREYPPARISLTKK